MRTENTLHVVKKHSAEEQLERKETLQWIEIRSAYLLLCACVCTHMRLHFLYGYVRVCAHAHDKSRFYVEMCEKMLPF